MSRGRPYTTKEIKAIKQDYIGGMHIDDIAEKYGRTSTAIRAKMRVIGCSKPYVRSRGWRSRYQYAIVTNDEYELPLTAYTDSIADLARLVDNIAYNGLLQHRMRVKRGQPTRGIRMYVGGQFVWGKIVQIDTEGDDDE